MSIRHMQQVFELPISDPVMKIVLMAIADHANEDDEAWPSVERLALYSGCCERTIQRKIKEAEAAGLMTVKRRWNRSSQYHLSLGAGRDAASGRQKVIPTEGRPDSASKKVGQAVAPGGDTVSPEPSIEPSKEPPLSRQPAADGQMSLPIGHELHAGTSTKASRKKRDDDTDLLNAAWAFHDEMAATHGLPRVQKLNNKRKIALRKCIENAGGLDGFKAAMARVGHSSWLTGRKEGRSGVFLADFDYLTRETEFLKLIEGGFDDHRKPPPRPPGPTPRTGRRDIPPGWTPLKFAEATQAEIDAEWVRIETERLPAQSAAVAT